MAEPKLNFNEEALDKSSGVYELYDRLYKGMLNANTVDAPTFTDNPPMTENGEVDDEAIATALQGYSEILMKNSAYLFANSIMSVIGSSSGGGSAGIGFLSRNGDTMAGNLGALYGFQAGYDGTQILATTIDSDKKSWVRITGHLGVSENADIQGILYLSNNGININNTNVLCCQDNALHITSETVKIVAKTVVDGSFELGKLVINESGIFFDKKEFYHGNNANKEDVDWTMCQANVHGTLNANGEAFIDGLLSANNGIYIKYDSDTLLSTQVHEWINDDGAVEKKAYFQFNSDLSIVNGYGIKFGEQYIIHVRNSQVVEFSAPNMIMDLGNETTQYIALQTGIYHYTGVYQIVSKDGDGDFRNSLSAGCGNSGANVLRTFFVDENNCGVEFAKRIRFGGLEQPALWGDNDTLVGSCPYKHAVGDVFQTDHIQYSIKYTDTTSPFRNLSKEWSATLILDTEAEFIAFAKPIEANFFAIKSELYKTRLIENTLFFDDGKFIEGVTDGIRYSGNSYFDGNLSSPAFSSGFAGNGWSIRENQNAGGYVATFDELTIRKKMRVYELEVQKNSFTNGSQWVSDACSGDEVREIA